MDRSRDLVTAAPLSELEERDGRFRALVESAFDAYYDWNIETGYNYFSEPLDALLGYRPGTLKWSFYAWFERVHPDDRRRVMGSLGRAFRHENHWQDDYRLRKRDNSYVFVRDNGLIIYGDRMRPVRMLGVIRDITQERERARALSESAELYRTLFAGAANPAVHVDREGCYLDANEAALGFFECSKEELLSRRFSEDFSADVVRLVDEAFSMKGRVESEVTIGVKGASKTLVLAIVPCRIGERDTFFCLGTDISSRQMLQERLEDVNTALRVVLEQTNQDKQDLERRIAANIGLLVAPTLDRLERLLRSRPEVACVQAVRENLNEIVRPFASRLTKSSESCVALSRRELEIANYVRLGKTTDEIAEVLCVSRSAVQFHRGNIRRKLGLKRGDQQLATALDSILADEAPKL